jgi:putative chitinase
LAYVLATVRWETGQTFQPVKEKRASKDKNPRLWKIQNRYWSSGFFGRGYVQITWEKNYQKAGERLAGTAFTLASGDLTVEADTLVNQPELVLQPPIAYAIAARGMREGWFTGKEAFRLHPRREPAGLHQCSKNHQRAGSGADDRHLCECFRACLKSCKAKV